jgi:hypothetical protein
MLNVKWLQILMQIKPAITGASDISVSMSGSLSLLYAQRLERVACTVLEGEKVRVRNRANELLRRNLLFVQNIKHYDI